MAPPKGKGPDPEKVRKLKDKTAEYFKDSKFSKAASTMEELVELDPHEPAHKLKLGDAYRRTNEKDKAIGSYRAAAAAFTEQGLVIKAIAAAKLILEIEPKNAEAQQLLGDLAKKRSDFGPSRAAPPPRPSFTMPPKPAGRPTSIDLPDEKDEGSGLELDTDDKKFGAGIKAPPAGEGIDFDEKAKEEEKKKSAAAPPPRAAAKPIAPPPPPPRAAAPPPKPAEPIEIEMDFDAAPAKPPPAAAKGKAPPVELTAEVDILEGTEMPAAAKPLASSQRPPPGAEVEIDLDMGMAAAPPPPVAKSKTAAVAKAAPPPPPAIDFDDGDDDLPLGHTTRLAAMLAAGDSDEEEELFTVTAGEEISAPPPLPPAPAEEVQEVMDVTEAAEVVQEPELVAEVEMEPPRPPPPKVPLFSELSDDAFVELSSKLAYRRAEAGEAVVQEGDVGRSFFVIVAGKVKVTKKQPEGPDLELATLGEGTFFGEMALLSSAPRMASVIAEEESELLEITDQVLEELVTHHPHVAQVLRKFYRQRLLNNVMAISPLFKVFDKSERKMLVEKFKLREVKRGEVVIAQGSKPDGLYVVMHGEMDVSRNEEGRDVRLATLKSGDLFGEMSLLTRAPATATVTAGHRGIVLRLPKSAFDELMMTHPQILELVSELSESRKRVTEAILSGEMKSPEEGLSIV
jgi:CRP-like cAMP-binding protein